MIARQDDEDLGSDGFQFRGRAQGRQAQAAGRERMQADGAGLTF